MTFAPNVDAALLLIHEILPRARVEMPEARAVIVGTQPPRALLALSGGSVQVTGWVPDIRLYLESAACFVSPLIGGTGIRNKILEAMAMGLPVVATPLSCEGIDVVDGENVLLGETPQALAEAAVALLRDESRRRAIAQAGQRLVHGRYTWRIVADRYEMLYDAVIAEHRSRRKGAAGAG
jgi:glycosyltransferase involved in cell wall biosynthesis